MRLTLLWAVVCVLKGALSYWLLTSQELESFVLIKNLTITSMTVATVSITVWAALRVARGQRGRVAAEGLARRRRLVAQPPDARPGLDLRNAQQLAVAGLTSGAESAHHVVSVASWVSCWG